MKKKLSVVNKEVENNDKINAYNSINYLDLKLNNGFITYYLEPNFFSKSTFILKN